MNPNGYPFMTRRQILERIDADASFAADCVTIIQERHERRSSSVEESMGWMASHTAKATKLAAKLVAGAASEKDRAEAVLLVKSYSKQLARVFRERELAARPELSAQAAIFGVAAGGVHSATPEAAPSAPPAETGEQALTPRKRGRPRGSKNKPKTEQPPRRRRVRA